MYFQVTEDKLPETLESIQQSPMENSILNKIGENGLLSYTDFCFLLAILSTPKRYIDTAFELFDVTGDVKMDAKVGGLRLDPGYQAVNILGICLCQLPDDSKAWIWYLLHNRSG